MTGVAQISLEKIIETFLEQLRVEAGHVYAGEVVAAKVCRFLYETLFFLNNLRVCIEENINGRKFIFLWWTILGNFISNFCN